MGDLCTCNAQLQPHDRLERVCTPREDAWLDELEDDPRVAMIHATTDAYGSQVG